jgi:hypothetical protein
MKCCEYDACFRLESTTVGNSGSTESSGLPSSVDVNPVAPVVSDVGVADGHHSVGLSKVDGWKQLNFQFEKMF